MPGIHLHIEGQVQGVGFRPFVFRLAEKYQLNGWVSNGMDGVHIEVTGKPEQLSAFHREIQQHPPQQACVNQIKSHKLNRKPFSSFSIRESAKSGPGNTWITPDLGLCPDCRKDLYNPTDRRFHYDFTTCTNCGPRYSIIHKLPYDRPHTSMATFPMCPACEKEYNNVRDRRYYSQTNSCPDCGISLYVFTPTGKKDNSTNDEAFQLTIEKLRQGHIVAVKGIGGFLLMADATNRETVQRLRTRKNRPSKPFALMYPSLEMIERDCLVSRIEKKVLTSLANPIVLLYRKTSQGTGICTEEIAPNLDQLGVMLGYTPLLDRLARTFNKPLIATSGNLSGSPIAYTDEQALQDLSDIADFFLSNNREIYVPQDDSVLRFGTQSNTPIRLRRSRGYAPTFFTKAENQNSPSLLALGAQLKSSFALTHLGNTYVSQYLGKLDNLENSERLEMLVNHFRKLLGFKPEAVLTDLHPDYESTRLAHKMGKEMDIPIIPVQHHKAHAFAVLSENDLLKEREPILSVVWDGTGYGEDKAIWGSEFFLWEKDQLSRVSHLPNYRHLLGDKMAEEPRISALSLFANIPKANYILAKKFSDREWPLYQQVINQPAKLQTSSMGRLFDAVASITGICDHNRYESEAAIRLEQTAYRYTMRKGIPQRYYPLPGDSLTPMLTGILDDVTQGKHAGYMAAKFHKTLVAYIYDQAQKFGVKTLAFSGGVFQNAFLVDLIIQELEEDFTLHFHQQLSPNDENISYGQLVYGMSHFSPNRREAEKSSLITKKENVCV